MAAIQAAANTCKASHLKEEERDKIEENAENEQEAADKEEEAAERMEEAAEKEQASLVNTSGAANTDFANISGPANTRVNVPTLENASGPAFSVAMGGYRRSKKSRRSRKARRTRR
jgi:hypothetical protein